MGLSFLLRTGVDYFMHLSVQELQDIAEEAIKLYGKRKSL
nr:MAG TPA: hypothetical protein [Caudoviricetes sp.]DAR93050.1 MAG TPA: hypothetical protein [Caudoviricetes sp.]DAY70428.1 MAG TPA: hypothetical protein [Caudoviricetes sp.]